MDVDVEREKIGRFIRAGLVGLSIVLLVGCGFLYFPKVIETFQSSGEEGNIPVCSVDCKEKKVALTFDIMGTDKDVEKIVQILKKHKIEAAFFVTGDWARKYPKEVNSLYQAGYDLGNGSQRIDSMSGLAEEKCREQILKVHKEIKSLTGMDMNLFRSPDGTYSEEIIKGTRTAGYLPIMWNVNSMDWKDYGTEAVVNAVCNNKELKEGSIVLCHSGTRFTKKALDKIITSLQDKGYRFVKLSEMLYQDNFQVDKNGRQMKTLSK